MWFASDYIREENGKLPGGGGGGALGAAGTKNGLPVLKKTP